MDWKWKRVKPTRLVAMARADVGEERGCSSAMAQQRRLGTEVRTSGQLTVTNRSQPWRSNGDWEQKGRRQWVRVDRLGWLSRLVALEKNNVT